MKWGVRRRDLMKTAVGGVAAGAWSALGGRAAHARRVEAAETRRDVRSGFKTVRMQIRI
jgi:hypothetical protein